jgi:hypothetical protein
MTSLRSIVIVPLLAVLGALSALALVACSDDDIFGDDSDEQVEISLTERDLSPGRVTVDAGNIEFVVKNDGDRVHRFAIDTPDGVERSDEIKPGKTANVTVDLSRGSYRMYDPRGGYRRRGVNGTVVVTSDEKADTVTERTVERTVVEEDDDDVDVPEVDEPEVQEPEVQDPPAAPPPPPVAPPTVTKTVPAPPPPPAETTETAP